MLSVNEINTSHVEGRILKRIVEKMAEESDHKQPDLIIRKLYKELPKTEQGGTVVETGKKSTTGSTRKKNKK